MTKFWLVTKAGPTSTVADILFHTDIAGLELQFKGGLTADEIVGLFEDARVATPIALAELRKA